MEYFDFRCKIQLDLLVQLKRHLGLTKRSFVYKVNRLVPTFIDTQ